MSKPKQDAVQNAVRVGERATERSADALPDDVEKAWEAWSRGVGKVDARMLALLRAAFEVGVEAARAPVAAAFGRKGGLVGGISRAASLSKERRQEIARKAAQSRWEKNANGRAGET